MMIGESRITNMLLSFLDKDVRDNIDSFINELCLSNFMSMNSIDDINEIFGDSIIDFLNCLSDDEKLSLRSWTGYNFRNINAILRGNWTYDRNGRLTDEKNLQYRKFADLISKIINRFQLPDVNFITYRGVTLSSFKNYGIRNLFELKNLSGKFMYEQGFTSTSMLSETSYFNKDVGDGENYNIQIRYLVSSLFDDGVMLLDNDLSYSMNQNEYLINKDSLSKVIDVKVNENDKTAILTVVPIPKHIWNVVKKMNNNDVKSR